MSDKVPIPPGYEEIRLPREGNPRGDFIGRHRRRGRYLELRSRSDGRLHSLDKAQLLPPGMWDLCEYLEAAAAAEGCTPAELVARLRREDPALLAAAGAVSTLSPHGHQRPTLEPAHADTGAGRRRPR